MDTLATQRLDIRGVYQQHQAPYGRRDQHGHRVVYLVRSGGSRFYKIGVATKDFDTRLRGLQTGNPEEIIICKTVRFDTVHQEALHVFELLLEERNMRLLEESLQWKCNEFGGPWVHSVARQPV